MPAWDDYTLKDKPEDEDTLMIKDNSAANKANKRAKFSGLWNWIVEKLAAAVISNLTTSNKTVIGALNELNSNIASGLKTIEFALNAGSSVTLLESNSEFSQILFIQGSSGGAYGAFILSGYGPGGTTRYHIANLMGSGSISAEISGNSFIVTNSTESNTVCTLIIIQGNDPDIE